MLASSSVFNPLTSFPLTPRMPLTSIHIETATVFSWTGFLCPTAWIHAQGRPLHASLSRAFAELDAAIVNVLLDAQAYGTVFVLAEDNSAYIEYLCRTFFPRCAALFESPALQTRIQLLCAATDPNTQWYSQMLHSICTTSPALRGASVVLTCYGPDALRAACMENAKHLVILPKTIRSNVVQPTPAQVFEQLCRVRTHLAATVTHHSAIDVVV
ncbi:hypothetical protein SPRG_09576 [Saprolegnia parasitica CBS 223.65]|uniref:Uncharacterized protein n=1 Tax=Saprolegnia parasitica (strain CBS 223.65) TaxID=695850 RepID=A0A067CDN2_SAPPC|nr:hypothetical protein SPRG_09576 [Saprolegnia parasitica CBS 223.65]KDO24932.1 hypothetical protein SPRG_09576 [Saprolegnia parasitica CBS 223.65]|eukprot:XP_012204392.1 hypothetical protein SPRG_09576 [Saprolegnia parasitica CBS 223.65]